MAHRTAVRFYVLNGFVDRTMRTLSHVDACVWTVLWRHADAKCRVRISHERVAESVGIHRVSAARSVRRLMAAELVRIVRRGGPGRPTEYVIRDAAE